MNEIRCSIKIEDRDEGQPARLVGVLMPYNTEARDRREVFDPGSLSWPESGIVVNRMHRRDSPIMLVVPIVEGNEVRIDAEIPTTSAGLDCLAEVRSGLLASLSVEFRSVRETVVGGVRHLSAAILTGAGLVDSGSYAGATVEARAEAVRRASERHLREFLL